MTFAVYNGSYISNKNTGLGVVSSQIYKHLDKDKYYFLSNKKNNAETISHFQRQIWLQFNVPKILKKIKPEFFLSPITESPLFSKVRKIVYVHDLMPLRFPKVSMQLLYYATYIPAILHNSELVLCSSKATAKEVKNLFKIPSKKLEHIPLAIDHKNIYPIKLERKNFFLVLGRHDKNKNLINIIKAISKIKNLDFKVYFAGPFKGSYTKNLFQLVKDLNLENKCEFKSWVSSREKLMLLNSCKALLIPSLWEGFGLTAIEAMACGTPVIASKRGSLEEILGNYAFFVDPLKEESIASAMKEVLNNESLFQIAQKYGPTYANRFQWKNTASQIDSLLQNF